MFQLKRWMLGGAVAVAIAGVARGQTTVATSAPATTQVSAEISSLINQLDVDSWRARQAAEDQLVAKGEAVRSAMKDVAANGRSEEQRSRAASVLLRLDQAVANRPTMISLHVTDANPRDVFASISKQSGIELPLIPEQMWSRRFGMAAPKVTADFTDEPFWLAINDVCRQTQTRMDEHFAGGALAVMQGQEPDYLAGPRSGDDRFIVVPMQATRSASISYAPGAQTSSSNLIQFRLYIDPHVDVANFDFGRLVEATDDKNQSLLVSDATPPTFSQGNLINEFYSPLHYPEDGYTKLGHLRGEVGVSVVTRSNHVELADAGAASQTHVATDAGKYQFEIERCVLTGGRNVQFSVKIQTAGMMQWQGIYDAARRIRLVDSRGQVLRASGGGGGGGGNAYTYNTSMTAPLEIHPPLKLVWDIPVDIEQKTIGFEFKDLPLPRP